MWPSTRNQAGATSKEDVMLENKPPSKEVVRKWIQQRTKSSTPPPSIEQIRRELGWGLVHKK